MYLLEPLVDIIKTFSFVEFKSKPLSNIGPLIVFYGVGNTLVITPSLKEEDKTHSLSL